METEPTRMCALLIDLADIRVLGVDTRGPRVRVGIGTLHERPQEGPIRCRF